MGTSVEALDLKTGEMKTLEFGLCVWASGVRPNDVSLDLAKEVQGARMLETDANLRVRGLEGSVFALGDCAKIAMPSMRAAARSLFEKADVNKDGSLSLAEFQMMIQKSRKEFPHLEAYLGYASQDSIEAMYKRADTDGNLGVTLDEFEAALAEVDKEHAVIDSPVFGVNKGVATYVLWKGAYWSNSVSFQMKLDMVFDWAKAWFLGRDTSRF